MSDEERFYVVHPVYSGLIDDEGYIDHVMRELNRAMGVKIAELLSDGKYRSFKATIEYSQPLAKHMGLDWWDYRWVPQDYNPYQIGIMLEVGTIREVVVKPQPLDFCLPPSRPQTVSESIKSLASALYRWVTPHSIWRRWQSHLRRMELAQIYREHEGQREIDNWGQS